MAAPTFIGAGAGVTIATGSAAVTPTGVTTATDDLLILQVLQDGVTASAVSVTPAAGCKNLAGTTSALTVLAATQQVGNPVAARQHLWVGRVASSGTCSVTVATTGDDLYCRLYVFRNVNSGTAVTDILENGTAGTVNNEFGLAAAITDTSVVTLGADRLAVQLVAVDDDNAVGPFTGMTGGIWLEAVAEYLDATGTDGCIQLQTGYLSDVIYWVPGASTSTALLYGAPQPSSEMWAQSFASGAGGVTTTVQFQARITGTPADNLTVQIQTDSGGFPSGTVLGSATVAPATLTTTPQPVTVALAATLSASTTYWLVWSRTGATSTSNFYGISNDSGAGYASGAPVQRSSSVWATSPNSDFSFTVSYGTAGTMNGGSYTMAASDNWGVLGFAFKPVPVVAGTNWAQPVADTLSLADAATTATGKTAAPTDTLTLADAATLEAAYARTQPDTLALTDAQAFDQGKQVADTLALADGATAERGIAQAIPDTLAVTDSTTTAAGKSVTVDDTLALTDAARLDRGLVVPDIVTPTDALALDRGLVVPDTLTVADLADPVKTVGGGALTQPVADTLSLTDGVALDRGLVQADTLAVADALASVAALARAVADTLSLADLATPNLTAAGTKTIADTVALLDALATQSTILRTVADTLSLADSTTAGRDLTRALVDALTLADSLTAQAGHALGRALADTVDLVDLVTYVKEDTGTIPGGRIEFATLGGIPRVVYRGIDRGRRGGIAHGNNSGIAKAVLH